MALFCHSIYILVCIPKAWIKVLKQIAHTIWKNSFQRVYGSPRGIAGMINTICLGFLSSSFLFIIHLKRGIWLTQLVELP